jgi:hypothetical protein
MVTVPFPVDPAAVRIAHAPPTETLFVVSCTSNNSVIVPGAFDDRQVASLQLMLLPPAEPTAWPRKRIATFDRTVVRLFAVTVVDVASLIDGAETSKGEDVFTPEKATIAPEEAIVPLPVENA